jgi:ABC-2 type transport system permease protein
MKLSVLIKAKLSGTTVLGRLSARSLRERDQLWVVPVALVGLLVAVGAIVFLLYSNYRSLVLLGSMTETPDLALYVAVIAAWVFVFLVGFPIAFSVLFFSRDAQLLVSLPIQPFRIVIANMAVLYLYALPIAALIFIPAIVPSAALLTGTATGPAAEFQFYLSAVVVTLVLPLVPLTVSVLLVTLLGRLFNVRRHRVALEALGMTVSVVALVGLQLFLSRSLSVDQSQEVSGLMQSVARALRGAIPPAQPFSQAFLPGGLSWLLLSVAGSAAAAGLAVGIIQRGFVRQITEKGTVRGRSRHGPAALPAARSVTGALVAREMRLMTANSTFLFESVGELAVFPILLGVFGLSVPGEAMDQILPPLHASGLAVPIVFGALLLFAGINTLTAAGLSREGKSFDLSLSLPISGRRQAGAKILTYLFLFGGAFVINALLAVWLLRLQWWLVPLYTVSAVPFLVLIGSVTLFADVRRPLLNWSHPQQAVKQNMNVLVGMGLAILAIAAVSVPAVLAVLAGARPTVILLSSVAAALVAAPVSLRSVLRYSDRRYGNAFSSGRIGA